MATDIGTGITITLGGYTFQLLGIGIDGISRPAIDVSHNLLSNNGANYSQYREFKPGKLLDPGGVRVRVAFDDSVDWPSIIDADASAMVITFPSSETLESSAFATDLSLDLEGETRMEAEFTIKMTSAPTTVPTAA